MTPTRALLLSVLLAVAAARPAVAGLDPTFAGDGVAMTPFGTISFANGIALQPDGKIVAGGVAGPGGIMVLRHLSDGTLDPDFGSGGIVITPPPGTNGGFFALALQSDGKIVVAGVTLNGGSSESVLLIRYDEDGTLDATFGSGGMVVTTLAATTRPSAVALQSDGKIVVVGTIGGNDARDVVVLRYDSGGSLDPTFDGDGVLIAELGPAGPDSATALAIQPDGMIVVGAVRAPAGSPLRLALARYDSVGTPDPSFGSGGVVLTSHPSVIAKLALQADHKIVVGGTAGANGVGITVARFLSDGSPDTAFATNGVFTMGGTIGFDLTFPALYSLALDPVGRIVIGGGKFHFITIQPPTTRADSLLARLVNDGHTLDLDASFDLGGSGDIVFDVAVQPDGKIVGAGAPENTFTVIRYEPIVCGDGVVASTEGCDDGNTIDGDGCDHNCEPTGCGNGVVTAGESCDDGNTADGDCCSSTCQPEPAGGACPPDTNGCTDDVCDASGVCAHPPNTAPCDDGNLCTTPDTCSGGQCVGTPVACPLCQICAAASGACVDAPRPLCEGVPAWATAKLQIRDQTKDTGDAFQWKRGKGFTQPSDLGDPTTLTEYAVCLYDESQPTPALLSKLGTRQGTCGTKPCWKSFGTKGWKYQDKELAPDGVASMILGSSISTSSTLAVKARGINVPTPTLPLTLPARFQLQGSNGACWEATYSAAGVTRNDATRFKATND